MLEIVGAWLRIWTPPRDVDVPPVPLRKLAIGTLVGLVVCAGAAAAIVPAVNRGKERRARSEQAQAAADRAALRRQIVHDQQPRRGRAPQLRPSRTALLARVERAISRDAAARVRTGELRGPIGRTSCSPAADARALPQRGVFDCLTAVDEIRPSAVNAGGVIGYPFRAILNFKAFSYAWCKVEQFPGEKLIPDPRLIVQLPAACRLPNGAT
jgi:hypothetical protein